MAIEMAIERCTSSGAIAIDLLSTLIVDKNIDKNNL